MGGVWSMTGDDFEIPPELIAEALALPDDPRESNELSMTPPAIGLTFVAEGFPGLTEALAHPTLGPLLGALPDRLYWSKGTPEEIGAEGIELFLIAHAFALAGHPLRTTPPIRDLAALIHDRGKNRRAPRITALWRRLKGIYGHYWGQLIIADTLHGTDVLIEHFESIKALILTARRKYVCDLALDETDLDKFFERVTKRVVRAAMRFDSRKGATFPTFAFYHIDGAARDWRADYFGINLKTGERYGGRADNISIEAPVGADEDGEPLTIGDTLVDASTERDPEPERPSFAEVAADPRLSAKERDVLTGLANHKGPMSGPSRIKTKPLRPMRLRMRLCVCSTSCPARGQLPPWRLRLLRSV
jgi:hypothetical protein